MRLIIIATLILLTSIVNAQGTVSSMTEETTPVGADLLYLVKNPGGAGTSRKVTVTNLTKGLADATATVDGVIVPGEQIIAGQKTIEAQNATHVPLKIKLATTPTANAIEVNSSAGSGGNLFKVSQLGAVTFSSNITGGQFTAGAADWIVWAGRSAFQSPSNGVVTIHNNNNTDFARLQLGGTTTSFPAIKRNAAEIDIRLADDSAYANMHVRSIILESNPPATAASTGVTGTITWDAGFIYVCTATNTWKRVAIATW